MLFVAHKPPKYKLPFGEGPRLQAREPSHRIREALQRALRGSQDCFREDQ